MTAVSFSLLSTISNLNALQQEIQLLLQQDWQAHVNQRDYQGGWDVLPLRCAAEHLHSHALLQSFAIAGVTAWQDLPLLSQCPALMAWLHSLPWSVKSVRLMRLHAGALIKPHRDHGLCLEQGEARLHLPLQTHPELRFYVNEQQVPMQAGELWYINADQTHWVENNGQQDRINLVLDCAVNAVLQEQVYAGRQY